MAPLTAEKMYVIIIDLSSLYCKIHDIRIQITFFDISSNLMLFNN